MASCSDIIERKVVDTSGRLGSLYDAVTDNIIDQQTVQATEIKPSAEPYLCRVLSGNQSNGLLYYLKWMGFNDAMTQSILFGMVTPSGASSLINYNQSITHNTRLLYYSYRTKEEELILTPENVHQIISHPPSSSHATHMITKILWGFEILCVIPIPDYQTASTVDSLLRSIHIRLKDNKNNFVLTDGEKKQVTELINVTVYGSKTCVANPNTSLLTVLTSLIDWQKHENFHHPLKYTMCSLRWLYNNTQFPEFSDLSEQTNPDIAKVQPIIIRLDNSAKSFRQLLETLPESFASPILDQALKNIQEHFHKWFSTYEELRRHLQKMLADIRQCRVESKLFQDVISNQQYALLKENEVNEFNKTIRQLLTKRILINRLNEDEIQYINVLDLRYHGEVPRTLEHIEKAVRRSLSKEDTCLFIYYSNDQLKHEASTKWEEVYHQFILKRQKAAQNTTLVYADFTNCHYTLKDLTIAQFTMTASSETPRNHPPDGPIPSQHSPTLQHPPKRPSPPSITEINVLLLGETGVGKSTFINAFVNYLIFDTLQQAEQNEPVVLIPVSFLTTVGDQFDEFTVKFGNVDPNEDHEHQGQSVTQQCKSYVFSLNDRLSLRLIDTPGIGDTRGIAQDDKNIDHILTYVNSLSHLNAVCLLLKPNASRLNVFFRSCVNQLFTYLTPIGNSNIVFCFTNARATFYAPGDTGPLLRKMLKKEDQNSIPFEKTNTFCFDSESFRYLAARKCDVTFDDFQKQECTNSWTTSVTQSVRLLKHILTREAYQLDKWQSPRKVALEISMLARPLIETLRLIIYNWTLCETNLINNQIILNSNPIKTEICSNCASSHIVQVGPFSIIQYQCVLLKTNATQYHQCSSDSKHFLIESSVKYEFAAESQSVKKEKFRDLFDEILFKCDILTHFMRQQRLSAQDDPFAPVLERFLNEEDQISHAIHTDSSMNGRLRKVLSSIKEIRVENSIKLNESNEKHSLNDICGIIGELKSYESVEKQIDSIKKSRQLKMKANQHIINLPPIKNKLLSEFINSLR